MTNFEVLTVLLSALDNNDDAKDVIAELRSRLTSQDFTNLRFMTLTEVQNTLTLGHLFDMVENKPSEDQARETQ